jgi:hypothetical protein
MPDSSQTWGGGKQLSGAALQRQLSSSSDAKVVLELVGSSAPNFDAIHAATALHRIAQHKDGQTRLLSKDARWLELCELLVDKHESFNAQGYSNVLWGARLFTSQMRPRPCACT